MDFLNKSIAQLSELFRSMTPGARVTAGLLLAVVVVSVGYLFRQGAAGPDAYLFGGEALSDGQLVRIEAAIAQARLSGAAREGNRLRVPAGQQAAYLAAVADADALPQNFNNILEDAIGKGGPWESAAAQRERLKIAKQQTLSEIVRQMSWVDDAVVLYDEQESREIGRLTPTKRMTASVNVQPVVNETLDARRAKAIQKLVASAVNMKPEDVNVTNLGDGGMYGAAGGEVSPEIFESEYYQTKVAFELQKREIILQHLRHIPGVQVGVNAELDDTREEVTRTVKPDPKGTDQHVVETSETSTQNTGATGGQPGPSSQGPDRRAVAAAPENKNETKSTSTETQTAIGHTDTHTEKAPYAPREVWATVTIPRSYIVDVWKSRNPDAKSPPKPEDIAPVETQVKTDIQDIVEPLLRIQANKGQDDRKYSSVVVLDALSGPPIEPPSMATSAAAWAARSWNTLAMLGVAIFSLMVLRGVVKNTTTNDAPAGTGASPALTLHADGPAAGGSNREEEPDDERPRLRLKKENSLKDDLVDIVREDPDAAADILRSWIGKAG